MTILPSPVSAGHIETIVSNFCLLLKADGRRRGYGEGYLSVPEKEGAGFGDLDNESAIAAQSECGFSTCVLLTPFPFSMGGGDGDTVGYAGVLLCRFPTPGLPSTAPPLVSEAV